MRRSAGCCAASRCSTAARRRPDAWNLEVDRATASALDALGQAAFDEAYERGRGMTREQTLAL